MSAAIAIGPRCLRCLLESLSGPVDFLGFDCFIACCTCACVMVRGFVGNCLISLVIFL